MLRKLDFFKKPFFLLNVAFFNKMVSLKEFRFLKEVIIDDNCVAKPVFYFGDFF